MRKTHQCWLLERKLFDISQNNSEIIENHIRLPFYFKINFFLYFLFVCLNPILSKHYMNVNILKTQFFMKWSMTSKVIEDLIRQLCAKIFLAHSFINRFWLKFIWILTLCRCQIFIKWSLTSEVIESKNSNVL